MENAIQSREVFSHPSLSLIEDRVRLPNGEESSSLRFKDTGNGVILLCGREERFLLLNEYARVVDRVLLQFPGGFVPYDEPLEQGANRELREEAKLRAASLTLLGSFWTNSRRSRAKTYVYLATDFVEDALPADPDERIEGYRWLSESEIDSYISGGEEMSGYALAAWALYKARRK